VAIDESNAVHRLFYNDFHNPNNNTHGILTPMLQFINNHPVKLIVPAQDLSCMVLIQFNGRKSDQTGSFQDFKPMTNTEIIKYMEYFLELSDCDIIQGTFPPCCKS